MIRYLLIALALWTPVVIAGLLGGARWAWIVGIAIFAVIAMGLATDFGPGSALTNIANGLVLAALGAIYLGGVAGIAYLIKQFR